MERTALVVEWQEAGVVVKQNIAWFADMLLTGADRLWITTRYYLLYIPHAIMELWQRNPVG
jgi:hypothetical protein